MNSLFYIFVLVLVNTIDKGNCLCGETFNRASARITIHGNEEKYIADKCVRNLPIEDFILLSPTKNIYPGTFSNLFQLLKVELNGADIETVEPGFLETTPKINVIKLERNKLESIEKYTFDELKLKTLDFSTNKINKISEGAFENSKFEYLCLSNNKLKSIDPLWFKNTEITALSITHNGITYLSQDTFTGIQKLKSLKLSYNKIRDIDYNTFNLPDLEIVYLPGNMLKEINFQITGSLKNIDVAFNRINSISLTDSVPLWIVSIYPNPFDCACLRKFWKFADSKEIRIWDTKALKVAWKDSYPLCISQTNQCNPNEINTDEIDREYLNTINYRELGRPVYRKEDDFLDLEIVN